MLISFKKAGPSCALLKISLKICLFHQEIIFVACPAPKRPQALQMHLIFFLFVLQFQLMFTNVKQIFNSFKTLSTGIFGKAHEQRHRRPMPFVIVAWDSV